MNIFYLHHDTKICAEWHVDRHAVKMILEYAQLLSTAHRVLDGQEVIGLSKTGRKAKRWKLNDNRDTILYSATHMNHPSAVWARQSKDNYIWLTELLNALCKEYTYRYGKVHKVEHSGLLSTLVNNTPINISCTNIFTEPTTAMPDEYKVIGSSIQSYRKYYAGAKSHMFKWKNRVTPEWINNANIQI
jgi:hypothetical protein